MSRKNNWYYICIAIFIQTHIFIGVLKLVYCSEQVYLNPPDMLNNLQKSNKFLLQENDPKNVKFYRKSLYLSIEAFFDIFKHISKFRKAIKKTNVLIISIKYLGI